VRTRWVVTLKRLIRNALDRAGYILVRKGDYLTSVTAVSTASVNSAAHDDEALQAMGCDREFQAFYQPFRGRSPMPLMCVLALYSAARYLIAAKVPGEVASCGSGSSETLRVLAAALAALGSTERALTLVDASGDPTHQAEHELALWGGGDELPSSEQPPHRATVTRTPVPSDLVSTGYPVERIRVVHAPPEPLPSDRAIAFLGLTSDRYPANLVAIRQLFPRVPIGGVVAVERSPSSASRDDAVSEYLEEHGIQLFFTNVTPRFRLGVTCGALVGDG
jgi:hypothetical protein